LPRLSKINAIIPAIAEGKTHCAKTADDQLKAYQSVLWHFHIHDKTDHPGPALQWDYLDQNARRSFARGVFQKWRIKPAGQHA